MGEIKTDSMYWDCDCKDHYIHYKSNGNYCKKCKTYADDQPDSRVNEIQEGYFAINDMNLMKRK